MPFASQIKLLRAVREILLGDSRSALAGGSEPKPAFPAGHPPPVPLPRSTPEREGLSSDVLDGFYRAIAAEPHANAHSILVLRHGKVACEGYFSPYRADIWHVTHSLCKSFVGTATGLAISEGLFGLDDPIVEHLPLAKRMMGVSRRMRAVTVRHLLTMSSGITYNELSEAVETNWLRGALASSFAFEPGTRFVYNSMNSYLLCALVCEKAGTTLTEYLRPRLFEPMGFGPVAWEKSPEGIEKGGWGMYMMVEDMAKFGQLYLQKGRWTVNGVPRQLVPESWVKLATTPHITTDRSECYGFQLWVDAESGSFIMSGMFGQYILGIPELDIVVAMTAGNPHMFTESPAYDEMQKVFSTCAGGMDSLPDSPLAYQRLQTTLAGLRFRTPVPPRDMVPKPLPRPARRRPWPTPAQRAQTGLPAGAEAFCGTTWRFPKNRAGLLPIIAQAMDNNFTTGLAALRLELEKDHLALFWEEGGGTITLPAGFDDPLPRKVTVDGETFLIATRAKLRQNEDGEDVLIMEVCLLEHSSLRILKLRRMGRQLELRMDEAPQFMLAIETALNQSTATGASLSGPLASMGGAGGREFIDYRIEQLCMPRLTGTPVHADELEREAEAADAARQAKEPL